jgi:hypothetical protein
MWQPPEKWMLQFDSRSRFSAGRPVVGAEGLGLHDIAASGPQITLDNRTKFHPMTGDDQGGGEVEPAERQPIEFCRSWALLLCWSWAFRLSLE